MIKLIGKLKHINNIRILSVYSKNLAKGIERRGNLVSIKDFKEGIILKPGKEVHATIAQQKRIQISITNLIKKGVIKKEKTNKKEISVYLNLSDWGIEEILRKGVGSPLTKTSPKNLISKRAAIACKGNQYYIDLSIKRLYEICKNNKIKCLLKKDNEGFILVKSNSINARRLTPHSKKRVQISLTKEILDKIELDKLSQKSWLPIYIKLNLKSFYLEISDFYSITEEKELVKYFSENNTKIKIKDYRDPYDIKLIKYNSLIEIHNSNPNYNDLTTRHKIKAGQVRLRILEADFWTRNKGVNKFFIVINKKWESGKYIKELTNLIDKKVKVLFTDFQNEWYKKIGEEIIKHSKNHLR